MPIEILMPQVAPSMTEGNIIRWTKKVGEAVKKGEILLEIETDKALVEVEAQHDGVLGKILVPEGSNGVKVESPIALLAVNGESPASLGAAAPSSAPAAKPPAAPAAQPAPATPTPAPAAPAAVQHEGRVFASPLARRIAKEMNVDLARVAGSGPNGRVLKADVEAASRATPAARAPEAVPAAFGPAWEDIPHSSVRRVIAQRLGEAKRNIPHFAYVEELDVTELEALRRHLNSKLERGAPGLTYLPFLGLALVRVLRDFPQCNAHYDAERGVIVRHAAVHLGVATQTPDGLKVPVVHDAEKRSLWDLAAEIRRVSEAARTNKATREELTGSTITITSLGKLGGIASTPIINAPEVAIIGVNRALERPVVLDGAIAIRLTMNLSSSFDHRFVDGYDAAAMIQALKECLEHPATIFIGG